MFELKEIKEAHSKVKTGTDFPNYVQDLIKASHRWETHRKQKLSIRKYAT